MFNPAMCALFGLSQKRPEQRAKEASETIGDNFAMELETMTPEERREFCGQHDRDVAASDDHI